MWYRIFLPELALDIDAEPGRSPEGLFFPDTYVFSGRTSDRDILRQAYETRRY